MVRMRVVVDLQSCQTESRFGGIGRYSMDLLKSMIRIEDGTDFIVLLNQSFPQTENEIRSSLRNLVGPNNFVSFPAPRGCASSFQNTPLTRAAEILREDYISSLNPDVVHISSLIEGVHEDVVTSIGRRGFGPPTAVTFYDLIPLVEKDTYLLNRMTRSHYFEKLRSLSKADALLAISDFVAQEGNRLLNDFHGLMTVIAGVIGSEFIKLAPDSSTSQVRRKFSLSRKIILYVASFDQRKNQGNLIQAFSRLKNILGEEYQLALAGGGSPQIYAKLQSLAEKSGLAPDDVIFLGRVSDAELIILYNCCSLFVFPPFSEGLGMPPLEAAACGAVVIGSATSSISEVIGWSEALFDPYDVNSIAAKMLIALRDEDFRLESRRFAVEHIKTYQWAKSASKAMKTLRAISKNKGAQSKVRSSESLQSKAFCEDLIDSDLSDLAQCCVTVDESVDAPWLKTSPKVGWVSSWGGRCGIADYSRHLLATFTTKPTIFASYKGRLSEATSSAIVRCWDEGKEDYLVELDSALRNADVETVHIQFNFGFFDLESLRRLIISLIELSKSVFITLHSTMDQSEIPSLRLEWIGDALKLCDRIFIHSSHDIERLAVLGIVENVTLIPLGLVVSSQIEQRVPNKIKTIMTYGFALPGKGLVEVVEAIALMHAAQMNVRLVMLNSDYQDRDGVSLSVISSVQAKIEEHGLQDVVTTDFSFIPEASLFDRLSEADILIFPYTKTGESGSAAVRAAISVNRMFAVTPLPIFDDVREAAFVLPGLTPRDLANGLSELIAKMDSEHPSLDTIAAARRRVGLITSYEKVGNFIEDEMKKAHHFSEYTPIFKSSISSLSLLNAFWEGAVLVAEEQGGIACYGPYIDLRKGIYRLSIDCEFLHSTGQISLTITSNTISLFSFNLTNVQLCAKNQFTFIIDRDLQIVELLFDVPKHSKFRLKSYILEKRWR